MINDKDLEWGGAYQRRAVRVCRGMVCNEHHSHYRSEYRQMPDKYLIVPLDDPESVRLYQKILDAYTSPRRGHGIRHWVNNE